MSDIAEFEELEELEAEFSSIENDMAELTGSKEARSTSSIKPEEKPVEEVQEDFYCFLEPEDKVNCNNFLDLFEKAVETVPGQLIVSPNNLNSNLKAIDKFQAGRNVAISRDEKQFYSLAPGQLSWNGNIASIVKVKRLKDDLYPDPDNEEIERNLIVEGDITEGVNVKVKGDIYVFGNILKSNVQATGNIYVKNGIKGSGGGNIKSNKNIYAKFIESANVSANKNVIVYDAIMRSKVLAKKNIIVSGGLKNLIVGGSTCAGSSVYCSILGSESYTSTEVVVGMFGDEKKELDELRIKKNRCNTNQLGYDKEMSVLISLKSENSLNAEQAEKLKNLKIKKQKNKNTILQINNKIKEVEKEIEKRKQGSINVSKIVYPGVKITVNKAISPINKVANAVRIFDKNANLGFEPYKPPDFQEIFKIQKTKKVKSNPKILEECKVVRKNIVLSGYSEDEILEKASSLLVLKRKKLVSALLDRKATPKGNFIRLRIVEVKDGENPKLIKQKITPVDYSKPIQVEGDSLDECLEKGSKYFKTRKEKLDYSIIQKSSKGMLGVGKKKIILKIFLKPKKENLQKSNLLKDLSKDLDGYFTIQNLPGGLMLTVYPPKGDGKTITEKDVFKDLKLYGFETEIDSASIVDAVNAPSNKPVKIGPRQPEPELDGKFEVHISEDKLKASIIVYPPEEGGVPVTKEKILDDLNKRNIKNIKADEIDRIFKELLWADEILVAEGKPAINGKDAEINYKIDIDPEKPVKIEESDDGKVDFHELNLIENVVAGQTLAVKMPSTEGQNGIDVYGEIIESTNGEDTQLQYGKNVSISDDGMELTSDIDGQVVYDGKKVRIEPIYHVNGDVDYSTGNVTFLGTVIVSGTIKDDFIVRATGDIVANHIAGAEVEAEGNIFIRGGISGRDKAMLKAGKNIIGKFIEQSTLSAGENIIINEAIMHSNVSAGKNIVVLEGKRGLVVGGTIRAAEEIYAKEIGSKIATKTQIEVGVDPTVRQSILNLEKNLEEQRKNYDKVRKGIKALSNLKKKIKTLPPQKESLLLELVGVGRVLNTKLQNIQQELKALQVKMRESRKGKVCVQGVVFTGVKITIRNATLHIDDEFKFVKFFYEDGEVKFTQYEDPPTRLMVDIKEAAKEPKTK